MLIIIHRVRVRVCVEQRSDKQAPTHPPVLIASSPLTPDACVRVCVASMGLGSAGVTRKGLTEAALLTHPIPPPKLCFNSPHPPTEPA